jgi:transposase
MLLKTILNKVQKHLGFVFGAIRLIDLDDQLSIEIEIEPRKGSKPICSKCHTAHSGYDTLSPRRFEFVPLWGIAVFFIYAMRRVNCPICGIKVECAPWAVGKNHLTVTYAWFLSHWARRMSWQDVAVVFNTSWDNVYRSVKMAVEWGLEHRDLNNIKAIGVDEIAWLKKVSDKFLTLVYQIDTGRRRLLWVGRSRTEKTLQGFFDEFGKARTALLRFIGTDMWVPYLNVIARNAPKALNILDRFHIVGHMNDAVNEVRVTEVRELKAKGQHAFLSKTRWCLLKRVENLTENQAIRLKELVAINLKTVRAYLLKEVFQMFWAYKRPSWAGRFLDAWCRRAMRSRIQPMKKVAKMLRSHRALILNWFRTNGQVCLGAVEGLNGKAKLTIKKAYGYKSYDVVKIALYHTLGDLPEPKRTHRFCG